MRPMRPRNGRLDFEVVLGVRILLASVCCTLIAVAAAGGCHHVGPLPGEGDDGDDDGAGDTDGDADGDSDVDSDSDADSETATDDACPLDSGWPCTCVLGSTDGEWNECDDGSFCAMLVGLPNTGYGICMAPCDGPGDQCPPHGFTADAQCAAEYPPESQLYCILLCSSNPDCPPGQTCKDLDYVGVCHP